ncbi:hypothetical protein [Paenibacillus sp. FSL K6-2862]|uniref:hypothetical protein n=1 Tax=Paenibacillus sp. FSL K6-2862 TaxID=2921484 RepID=UPI0030F515B5
MKRVLAILLYPFAMVLGLVSGASFGGDTGNGVRLIRDVVTDRNYDGQALYDQLEHRNT